MERPPAGSCPHDHVVDPIRFEYEHHHLDAGTGVVTCSYVLGSAGSSRRSGSPRVPDSTPRQRAPRHGSSFWRRHLVLQDAAPPVIDSGQHHHPGERDWLRAFYLDGLGEFAYRNGIDLSGLTFEDRSPSRTPSSSSRPVVPPSCLRGGIDSIVTTEESAGTTPAPPCSS